jgi:hypothetical protein
VHTSAVYSTVAKVISVTDNMFVTITFTSETQTAHHRRMKPHGVEHDFVTSDIKYSLIALMYKHTVLCLKFVVTVKDDGVETLSCHPS